MQRNELFFKDEKLPYLELRSSRASNKDFKPHMHKRFCIGIVEEGEVLFKVRDTCSSLTSGALALINPETLHSCNSTGTASKSYSMLYLDVAWCLLVQSALWHVTEFVPVTRILLSDRGVYDQYRSVLQMLSGSRANHLDREQKLYDLVSVVFRQACSPQQERDVENIKIEEIKTILGSNLHDDVSLKSIAQSFGENPYTMLRRFKKVCGITPHAYRTNCRVEQARQLLQQGMDICDIAYKCGFYDQSHLHRHFKALTTVTPQEYRVNFLR